MKKLDDLTAHLLGLHDRIAIGGEPVQVDIDITLFNQIEDIDSTRFGIQNPLKHMILVFQL